MLQPKKDKKRYDPPSHESIHKILTPKNNNYERTIKKHQVQDQRRNDRAHEKLKRTLKDREIMKTINESRAGAKAVTRMNDDGKGKKIKNEVARDTTISGRSMNEGMARKMFNHNFRKFNPGGDVPKANLTQEKNKGGQMQYVYSATVGTSPTEMNSPANGNAFTGAMAKTGGDYDKAKEMLDGMPMMGKPKEGISSRIKSRLGLGK